MKEPITIINKIELNSATISLRNDRIILYSIKDNITISAKDSNEMVEAAGKLGNFQKFPVLIVGGKHTLADKEAREFGAGQEGTKYALAVAFVLKSLAQKILGNAYIKINKPIVPTRLFDNEEKAIEWLKTFLK
ncbi:MAG TPA: hypothetical protein VJI69_00115 [Bacteroidia bacterium]|nr:hypothetical protein [Bacteroidia bacterium]